MINKYNINIIKLKNNLHPTIIWNEHDAILIDTGLKENLDELLFQIKLLGIDLKKISKVILTHQDIDHFANAKYFRNNGAKIYASTVDGEFIMGKKKLEKLAFLENNKGFRSSFDEEIYKIICDSIDDSIVDVDILLNENDIIDAFCKIRIIDLSGHTSGHIGIYLVDDNMLISGDSINIVNNIVSPPDYKYCSNALNASYSYIKIKNMNLSAIISYHDGLTILNN